MFEALSSRSSPLFRRITMTLVCRRVPTITASSHQEKVETRDVRASVPRVPQTCLNPLAGIIRLGLVVTGVLCIFEKVPPIFCVPVTSLHAKDTSSISFLERTAFDLLQRDGGTGSGKGREIFPKRNMWELITASTDVIPLRSNLNNNSSSQYFQWPSGSGSGGSSSPLNPQQTVETRLQKLQHHFNSLRVYDEDCRQRLLCEIAESPPKFAPLTSAFLDETSFNGDEKSLASKLLETNDGARLLTYIEAAQRGISRQGCEIWTYRCPRTASSMIDFKALLVWREISKWLTVKFVAKKNQL